MSQTLKLHTQIGAASFTDNTNVVEAPNGFTANVMILPDDAHSTVADLYQVGTFTAPYNSKSQVVTLPDVDVPEGSQPVKLSIRPVASYLMRSEGNGTTDSNGVADNLTRVDDTIDTDRDRIVLSNVTVGSKDLELIGTLALGKKGAKVVTFGNTNTIPSGAFASYTSAPGTGSLATLSEDDTSLPVATVKTTIQAGVPFTKFVIKKGYPLPSDTSAVDSTGALIEFSKMQGLVDGSNNLLDEYEVDGSVVNFVAPFQSAGIIFHAGTQVPEGTLVELVIPTFADAGSSSTASANASDKKLILYPYGGMPQFTIDLSSGTKVDALVPLYDGSSIPPGYRFKAGTSFSDANSAGVNYQVHFRNVVGAAGFQLAPTTTLQYVVPTASPAKIRSGMTTSSAISLPAGSSTTEPLDVENGLSFPSGVSLVSALTIKEQLDIDSSVVAAKDSVLGVGTKIASGSASLEGSIITTPITLDSNSTVSDEYDVTSPFTVTANATLNVGAEIRDATLPSGTEITPNNILPAVLKLTTSMGVSLLAAAELIVGTVMGSGYQLKGNLGFSPKGVIPAFSSITGIFDLPARTHLKAGALFTTTDVPVPDGTTLRKDSVMPKGFIFGEGSHLPEFDLSSQLPPISTASAASNPLVLDSDDTGANGDDFIRLGAGVVLVSGFLLQKGSVFSAKTAGGTTGYTQATTTTGGGYDTASSHAALTLNAAEYSLDAGLGAAADDLTLYSGDVVPMDIYLTTDVHTDRELFLKYDGSSNALKKVQLTSNFALTNDLVLDADYKVSGSNTVFWPRNHPLPFDFTLTASAVFGASGVATMLNRDIQLNVPTTQDYVYGILPSASILKFPAQAYTLTSNIKLASDIGSTVGTTATSGYYASKAPIDLPKGAKLATSAAVKLITPMQFNGTFAIATDITTHPKFVANGGIKLLAGHVFPGSVTIPAGSPLPKNITLSTDVTLAAAYVVTLTSFTLSSGSSLGAESVLAAGSSFPTGLDIYAKVQLAPIVSLDSANIFGLFDDETINADIKFPQIWNSTANTVAVPNFNASGLIKRILDLVNQVASLEQQIQHQ